MRSLFLALVVVVLACSFAYAAPVGNPTEPAFIKGGSRGKLSGIVNIVMDRGMKEGSAEIDRGTEYILKPAYNFKEKMEFYVLAGAADGFKITGDTEFVPGSSTDTDLKLAILVGGGATFVIYETDFQYKPLKVGADIKLQFYKTTINDLLVNSVNTKFIEDDYESIEWQIALGASYQYERFIPYAGIKYSDVKIKKEASVIGTSRSNTLNADNIFGIFLGCDYTFNDNVKLNVEGRFIDETAFNFGATLMY